MEIEPIGFIESPYQEKFGVPRQSGLVTEAEGVIRLVTPWDCSEAIRGMDAISHLWVTFGFHLVPKDESQKPTARPPRLGGNERMGIFATRSPFRPNRLGLSLVNLLGHEPGRLQIGGVDMVDGTPVYDIKPYLPWTEAKPEAKAGFASEKPDSGWKVEVAIEVPSESLRTLILATLAHDPRPAFHGSDPDRVYGMKLDGHDVRWKVEESQRIVKVIEIVSER
ncbi:MAG: tRNA (N6-threonylcarbamoyladenosine(37)-N6)-methyltransferase TrmO [Verrucomicrobiota bacterium]